VAPERQSWMDRLSAGLRKTGFQHLSQVFTGAQIDDALYEELETALLMADTGVAATAFLLNAVKQKVAATGATRPVQAKNILVDALDAAAAPTGKSRSPSANTSRP
jgi:fused signal recognition particle receptor